jgi:hypothetical protein
LESVHDGQLVEIEDDEPEAGGNRLELLAVVRGLESLDQPSRITLVTSSRYVARGFRYGLDEWRRAGWQWERFGQMAPISNEDLWRRIDGAMRYHAIDCRVWRFDGPAGAGKPAGGRGGGGAVPRPHAWRRRRRSRACGAPCGGGA